MRPTITSEQLNKTKILLLALLKATPLTNMITIVSLSMLSQAIVMEVKKCYTFIKNLNGIITDPNDYESEDDVNEHGVGYGTPPSMYYRTRVEAQTRNPVTVAVNLAADIAAEHVFFMYQESTREQTPNQPAAIQANPPENPRPAYMATRIFPT